MRSDLAADGDPLRFGERIDVPFRAAQARPGARRADTTEWGNCLVVDGLVVDVDDAAGDALGQFHALHHVPCEDSKRQSVLRVACKAGSLVERREPYHRGYRAEDLVDIGWHARCNIGEDGGPVEQSFVAATGREAGAHAHA